MNILFHGVQKISGFVSKHIRVVGDASRFISSYIDYLKVGGLARVSRALLFDGADVLFRVIRLQCLRSLPSLLGSCVISCLPFSLRL